MLPLQNVLTFNGNSALKLLFYDLIVRNNKTFFSSGGMLITSLIHHRKVDFIAELAQKS